MKPVSTYNGDGEAVIVTVASSQIRWVDGLPVPVNGSVISKDALHQMARTTLSTPYEPTKADEDNGLAERYAGLTKGEVMYLRLASAAASGDVDAVKILLDRTLGKPVMHTENKNLNINYKDYLEEIAKKEQEIEDGGSADDL